MSAGLDDTKAKIFDRMYEVSKQEDFHYLQQYFIHPERILKAESLSAERRFDYLQLALHNNALDRR